jgi:hypothetical protein
MAAPCWSERPGPPNARREDGQRNWRQRRSMRDKSRALCVESSRWKSRKMRSTKSAGAGSSGGGRRPAAKFSGPNNTPGRSLGKETRTRMADISHDVCVNVKRGGGLRHCLAVSDARDNEIFAIGPISSFWAVSNPEQTVDVRAAFTVWTVVRAIANCGRSRYAALTVLSRGTTPHEREYPRRKDRF